MIGRQLLGVCTSSELLMLVLFLGVYTLCARVALVIALFFIEFITYKEFQVVSTCYFVI